jgi:hypothetical protein
LRHRNGGCGGNFLATRFEMNSRKSMAWILLLVPLAFAGIWCMQQGIDVQLAAAHQEQDDLMLRSSKLLKAMSLEYAPLVADIYWTHAVQYYGSQHAEGDKRYELLWPLLDITTTLDPQFLIAYRFGAVFLSDAPPRGAGRPDLAVALIQRGIRANPDYWRLYQDLGFIYYLDVKDYAKAAEAFYEGSKNPNALVWMKVMAAKIAAEGDSVSTSIFLWKDVYENTKDSMVKQSALNHLELLKVQQDCAQLDALADQYEKHAGRRPARIQEMIQAGLLRGVPVDPRGYPYTLDEHGKAQLNLDSPLLEQQILNHSKNLVRRQRKPFGKPSHQRYLGQTMSVCPFRHGQ